MVIVGNNHLGTSFSDIFGFTPWLHSPPSKQCDYFYGYMTGHIPIKVVICFLTWSLTTFYGL